MATPHEDSTDLDEVIHPQRRPPALGLRLLPALPLMPGSRGTATANSAAPAPTTVRQAPGLGSLCRFLVFAAGAIAALRLGHAVFQGDHMLAHIGRALCAMTGIVTLVAGSRWLLRRDGIPTARLGLGRASRHGSPFAIGTAIAVTHSLLLVAALYAVAPFEISAGPLPVSSVVLAAAGNLTGSFVEELLFRGYLLVVLARWLGATKALWLLALPFGLFHFQGLGLPALGQMVLTAGAMHFIYGYAWIATRSLATAVALHAVGNTLLHEVLGTSKEGVLALHFYAPLPDGGPFLVFFGVSAALAWLLSRLPAARRGASWLEGAARPFDPHINERT